MAIPLIGSPAPADAGAILHRLIGASSNFSGGLGDWTATAGTISYQTTYKFPSNSLVQANPGALRWAVASSTAKLSVPVPGVFKEGRSYVAIVAFGHDSAHSLTDRAMWMRFGLVGTDAEVLNTYQPHPISASGQTWQIIRMVWVPVGNRTGVTIELQPLQATSMNWYVGAAMVFEINPGQAPIALAWPGAIQAYPIGGNFHRQIATTDGAVDVAEQDTNWTAMAQEPDGSGTAYLTILPKYASISAEHTPGDRTGFGVFIEAGDDYVGIALTEKAADEVQIHPDIDDYWVTLQDGFDPGTPSTKGWRAADDDGNVTGLLSKSPFRHLAAAPGSPAEGDCYYDTVTNKLRVYDGTIWQDAW